MKQRTCLLIDDDLDDQEIFTLALQHVNKHFICISMASAHDALIHLNTLENALPDYIFLDLNMPRMNGKEFLREIKTLDHIKGIPVIIYSTSSLANDIKESRELGAADFITKPFSMIELIDTLRSFFEAQQQRRAS
jgi:CheY-like chemotaxis protein